MVEQLQALADERQMRVTFLSGGTGAAGVAQFYRCVESGTERQRLQCRSCNAGTMMMHCF